MKPFLSRFIFAELVPSASGELLHIYICHPSRLEVPWGRKCVCDVHHVSGSLAP